MRPAIEDLRTMHHQEQISLPAIETDKERKRSKGVDENGEYVLIYDKDDLEWMRRVCRFTAEALDRVTPAVKAGVTTQSLNDHIALFAQENSLIAATLNYKPSWAEVPFPASCCISINEEVNHGIPSERILLPGDIVNIDVTFILVDPLGNRWHGDSSRTFFVGSPSEISPRAKRLVHWTYEAMMAGIREVSPGKHLDNIGFAIDRVARKNRLSTVREYTGHGIGLKFHDAPQVRHFSRNFDTGLVFEPGMIFTIEPMLNEGTASLTTHENQWTVLTSDKRLSAQFEHTVAVTEKGCEILTLSPKGYKKPPYL